MKLTTDEKIFPMSNTKPAICHLFYGDDILISFFKSSLARFFIAIYNFVFWSNGKFCIKEKKKSGKTPKRAPKEITRGPKRPTRERNKNTNQLLKARAQKKQNKNRNRGRATTGEIDSWKIKFIYLFVPFRVIYTGQILF